MAWGQNSSGLEIPMDESCTTRPVSIRQQMEQVESWKMSTNNDKHDQQENETRIVPLRVRVDNDMQSETLLEFECDWTPGIGGSVWTSGELLVAHLELQRDRYRSIFDEARVVELGSGTGYVGLMVAACFKPAHVYLTDLHAHVRGLRRNVERNSRAMRSGVHVHVLELSWGSSNQETSLLELIAKANEGTEAAQVDVILGTDVAYLQELYDPLLHTIKRLATSRTLVLLGLNRADTEFTFFQRLEHDGFEYYRIPDFQLPHEFWGRDFGLFEIRRSHD